MPTCPSDCLVPCAPFVQVGNEINSGILFPVGEISENGFDGLSQLLNSAVHGGLAAGSPKILIHLANGWDWSDLEYWYEGVFSIQGALTASEVDIMGVSFYPFYGTNATFDNLQYSLTNLANAYGKPIVVAETNWPVSCSGVTLSEPSIPVSVSGQEEWTDDIKNVLTSLPDGFGQGICEYLEVFAKLMARADAHCRLLGAWLGGQCCFRLILFGG